MGTHDMNDSTDAPIVPSPPLPATIAPFCTCQSIRTDARDCAVHGEQLRRNAGLA